MMLALLFSPIGRWLAALALVAAALGGAWLHGYDAASDKCDAAQLRAQIADLQRDLTAAKTAEADANRRASILDETLKANEERIDDYETALAARPDARCALNGDDVRRLRDLKP